MLTSRVEKVIKVFLSSTSQDLLDYRAVASQVILDMDWKPEMMEHFGAMPEQTVEACCNKLGGCDLMVLILAFRRGWVPTAEQGGNDKDSVTALELAFAHKNNIPVVMMLAAEDSWPVSLCEDEDDARKWIKTFRARLNQPAVFFDREAAAPEGGKSLPAFRAKLREALLDMRERFLAAQGSHQEHAEDDDLFASAKATICAGPCIPFLGHGIFGDGPLSDGAIIKALTDADCHENCLATAAADQEQFLRSRETFLRVLAKTIREQTVGAAKPAIYDLIVKMKPPLIVSTSHDLAIEERLEAEGKPVLLICHVIRSEDDVDAGKVVVFRGLKDPAPEISIADGFTLKPDEGTFVIYKPLGSPLLHQCLDPDKGIDTVVITETDHLTFLARLESQSTGIPTALTTYFRKQPLLFLGYAMDVWQYRLVLHVFRSSGKQKKGSGLSVRVPASVTEERAWRGLDIDLVRMTPNDFAVKVCEGL
ncbi:DUF4062 domain-containing protein [Geomonas azotofigens]|uniref:DUF4062 domain-containing protein n=1 Tax=Geomonas azotofigens TaxID=2843196 RepID=UPI001C10C622|nr:DUF4062 domain-containing protein [Geomonas azotofigens]MBU5611435.1 DUF4062 domain-containing protein [Geomonas azotofigens]